jgi:hypothetical protein
MKRIYTFLCLALAVSACQDEVLQPALSQYDNEMRFNLTLPGADTKVTSDRFEVDDTIGLYVTDYVDKETPMPLQISGNRVNNMTLTYNGRSWDPAKKLYWGEGKSDFYAYYPYLKEIEDVNSLYFAVAENQDGDGYEASDFLWTKTEGKSEKNGTIELAMKHAMSKLTVKIVAGEDYVFYEDYYDLGEKVEYYLSHDNERKEIAANGCRKVRQEHNYGQRIEKIIEIVMGE